MFYTFVSHSDQPVSHPNVETAYEAARVLQQLGRSDVYAVAVDGSSRRAALHFFETVRFFQTTTPAERQAVENLPA